MVELIQFTINFASQSPQHALAVMGIWLCVAKMLPNLIPAQKPIPYKAKPRHGNRTIKKSLTVQKPKPEKRTARKSRTVEQKPWYVAPPFTPQQELIYTRYQAGLHRQKSNW